jgi:hypothetical protein
MDPDALLLFGNLALRHHYVHRADLKECLGIQERMAMMGGAKRIGEILVDQEYLEPSHVTALLRRQELQRPPEEAFSRFGFLGVVNGLLDERDIRKALRLQAKFEKEKGMRPHIGEMLMIAGVLTLAERDALLACQRRVRRQCEAEHPPQVTDRDLLLIEIAKIQRQSRVRGTLIVLLLVLAAVASILALFGAFSRTSP